MTDTNEALSFKTSDTNESLNIMSMVSEIVSSYVSNHEVKHSADLSKFNTLKFTADISVCSSFRASGAD